MTEKLLLPPVLDLTAAPSLWQSLAERRDAPLALDGSQVERLGGLCLQVLLAAAFEWRSAGRELRIEQASEAFSEAVRTMGARALLTEAPCG